jgi:hypothetical protein
VFVRGRLLVQIDASTADVRSNDPAHPIAALEDEHLLGYAAWLPRDWVRSGTGVELRNSAAAALPADCGLPAALASADGLRAVAVQPGDPDGYTLVREMNKTLFYFPLGYAAAYFARWDAQPGAHLTDSRMYVELESQKTLHGAHQSFLGAMWDWIVQGRYSALLPIPGVAVGDEAVSYVYPQQSGTVNAWVNAYQLVFRRGHVRVTVEGDFPAGTGSFADVLPLARLVDARLAAADSGHCESPVGCMPHRQAPTVQKRPSLLQTSLTGGVPQAVRRAGVAEAEAGAVARGQSGGRRRAARGHGGGTPRARPGCPGRASRAGSAGRAASCPQPRRAR